MTDIQGTSVTINAGGSLNLSSVVNMDETSFIANDVSFSTPAAVVNYRGKSTQPSKLQANGADSMLNMSAVTTFEAGTNWDTDIQATAGGQVDLSGVTSITVGSIDVVASGANSLINLSNLSTYAQTNAFQSRFHVDNGGTIQVGNLQVLDQTGIDINNGTMNTAQLTTITRGSIVVANALGDFSGLTMMQDTAVTLNAGGSMAWPSLTNFDESSLTVNNGTTLTTPNSATSYVGKSSQPSLLRASGTNSTLDLSSVTSLEGGTNWDTNIQAVGGGLVDLSGLTSVTVGSIDVESSGPNSLVNLANLDIYLPTNDFESRLRVANQGEIQLGNVVTMDMTSVDINNGTLNTSQLTTFTNGAITVANSAADFSNLTVLQGTTVTLNAGSSIDLSAAGNIDESSFIVSAGRNLSTPAATAFQGRSSRPSSLVADGSNSLLDMSQLITIRGGDNWDTDIQALRGGRVDLSGVATIPDGSADVWADGNDSVVDLSGLAAYTATNIFQARIRATNGGRVMLSNDVVVSGANLSLDKTSAIDLHNLRLGAGGSISLVLFGNGDNAALPGSGSLDMANGGRLILSTSGFTPQLGDSFTVLPNWTSYDVQEATFDLPNLPTASLAWDVTELGVNGSVQVALAANLGDFDSDDDFDCHDVDPLVADIAAKTTHHSLIWMVTDRWTKRIWLCGCYMPESIVYHRAEATCLATPIWTALSTPLTSTSGTPASLPASRPGAAATSMPTAWWIPPTSIFGTPASSRARFRSPPCRNRQAGCCAAWDWSCSSHLKRLLPGIGPAYVRGALIDVGWADFREFSPHLQCVVHVSFGLFGSRNILITQGFHYFAFEFGASDQSNPLSRLNIRVRS